MLPGPEVCRDSFSAGARPAAASRLDDSLLRERRQQELAVTSLDESFQSDPWTSEAAGTHFMGHDGINGSEHHRNRIIYK